MNILGDVQDVLDQTAKQLQLDLEHLTQAAKLLQEGATLPFIAAYRKEVTGNMSMEQLHHLDRTEIVEDSRSEIIVKFNEIHVLLNMLLKWRWFQTKWSGLY